MQQCDHGEERLEVTHRRDLSWQSKRGHEGLEPSLGKELSVMEEVVSNLVLTAPSHYVEDQKKEVVCNESTQVVPATTEVLQQRNRYSDTFRPHLPAGSKLYHMPKSSTLLTSGIVC